MPMFKKDSKKRWFILKIVILLSLFACCTILLIKFVVFPRAVAGLLRLRQNPDGSLPLFTAHWVNPPSEVLFKFYMWNVTNQDEVIYNGAVPRLQEHGPYVYVGHTRRVNLSWSENGTEVNYRNFDVWHYNVSLSCGSCTEKDRFVLSGIGYTGMASVVARKDVHPRIAQIIDWATLITGSSAFQYGEQTYVITIINHHFRTSEVGELLFYSYNDPLIAVKESPLFKGFVKLMGGSILGTEIPEYPKVAGLLVNYNNSMEPEFRVKTGVDNIEEITRIVSYGGMRSLYWNAGEDIQNCNDGALNKPFLKPEDTLHIFNQFIARTFELQFYKGGDYESIPVYEYRITPSQFNTNSDKWKGMRYENMEQIDYFPTWPACQPDCEYNPNNARCIDVDCSREENLCDNCCSGSHFNDTIFTPPGFYAIRVFPGRIEKLQAALFCSPPHMLWAPHEVSSIYTGQHPDENRHRPVEWSVNPTLGGAVHAIARLQLNLPIWKGAMTQSSSLPNALAPVLWMELEVLLPDEIKWAIRLVGFYIPSAIDHGIVLLLLIAVISSSVIVLEELIQIIKQHNLPVDLPRRLKTLVVAPNVNQYKNNNNNIPSQVSRN